VLWELWLIALTLVLMACAAVWGVVRFLMRKRAE